MRTATAALQALINAAYAGTQFEWVQADLYTFYDSSGAVLARYTSADQDLSVNLNGSGGGPTYLCAASGAPLLKRTSVKFGIGTKVQPMTVTLMADSSKTINGTPWLQALRNGLLDGGRIKLYRFLSDAWTNTAVGAVIWFDGYVGALNSIGRSMGEIVVNPDLVRLDLQMPRELQQSPCANALYDVKCTLNPNSFKQAATVVAAGSSVISLNMSGLIQAAPYYDLGYVTFTSGPNSGLRRTIKKQSGGQLDLVIPLPQLCTNGDTANVFAGCDHTQTTCTSKFSNVINFRGAPYTPKPEMAT